MKFEKVCQAGLEYCQQNRILRVILPISVPLMLVLMVLQLLENVISLGTLVSAVIYLGFFLMLFLTQIASASWTLAQ